MKHIQGCGNNSANGLFNFICPVGWKNMQRTSDPTVRHCEKCDRDVFLCRTESEVEAKRGQCVAIDFDNQGVQLLGQLKLRTNDEQEPESR